MQPKIRRSGRGYHPPEEWSPIGQAKIQGTFRRSKRGLQVEEKGQSMEGRSRMAMSTERPDQGGAQCPREGTKNVGPGFYAADRKVPQREGVW